MNADCVVVDANIAFKSLISNRGDLRSRLDSSSKVRFLTPGYLFVELFKHKERLCLATGLNENEVLEALHALLSRIEFVNESLISLETWMEAYRLCKNIDEADTPYVALTLHVDGRVWMDDLPLKQGLTAKGFDRFFKP
jgi:predicted nucleic acid-binding protein